MQLDEHRARVGKVLQHLREQDGVHRCRGERQIVGRRHDVGAARPGVQGVRPVHRHVVGMLEELGVGGVACADVEDTRPWRG